MNCLPSAGGAHGTVRGKETPTNSENHIIEAKLVAYLREECLPDTEHVELGLEDNLFEHGIVDSAGLISFICFMEKEFNLTIPDEDLLPENFVSIASTARYIRSHQQVSNAGSPEMSCVGSR